MYDAICQFTPAREVQLALHLIEYVIGVCQLTPTREVQRDSHTRSSCGRSVNLPLHARCNGKAAFLLEDSTSISCTFCMQRLAACTVYLVQDYLFCKIAENLVESFPTARHVSDYGHFLGLRRYSPPKIRVRRSYGFYEDFPFALICFIVS